jgi:hypothetical protein
MRCYRARLLLFVLIAFAPTSVRAIPWTITVQGTVYADIANGPVNQTGIFGTPGASLVGDPYTETITTNPLLNTYFTESIPFFHTTYGGAGFGGCCAAPYTLSVTVDGILYTQTETNPFLNYSYLFNGIENGLPQDLGQFQDQVYQGVDSAGCFIAYGPCTTSYINAYSSDRPFVPTVDFSEQLTASSSDLDPGSNTYFQFRDGPTVQGSVNFYTGFYGSIDSIVVNPVPTPSSLPLFATGLGLMAWLVWRRRQPINVGGQS